MQIIIAQLETKLDEAKKEQQQIEAQLEQKPDFGLGEGSTFTDTWERALARKAEVASRIQALQEALKRAHQGTYGYCEQCGAKINPERLEFLPTATLCINCAQ